MDPGLCVVWPRAWREANLAPLLDLALRVIHEVKPANAVLIFRCLDQISGDRHGSTSLDYLAAAKQSTADRERGSRQGVEALAGACVESLVRCHA
ncbi:hypothetical protein [Frondihabitans sp. PhB188]|uniref:hypothetical protein n=1 Tax=Frondihabitans sp. PhB188 TaxID=2485200 RepID=UPI0013151589|nr:hypothetical protein [Frondihabitans sp. PhB188]